MRGSQFVEVFCFSRYGFENQNLGCIFHTLSSRPSKYLTPAKQPDSRPSKYLTPAKQPDSRPSKYLTPAKQPDFRPSKYLTPAKQPDSRQPVAVWLSLLDAARRSRAKARYGTFADTPHTLPLTLTGCIPSKVVLHWLFGCRYWTLHAAAVQTRAKAHLPIHHTRSH